MKCTNCGQVDSLEPINNMDLIKDKPNWECTHCGVQFTFDIVNPESFPIIIEIQKENKKEVI